MRHEKPDAFPFCTGLQVRRSGPDTFGIYNNRAGDWHRKFVGSYDLAMSELCRLTGEDDEPGFMDADDRAASEADRRHQMEMEG